MTATSLLDITPEKQLSAALRGTALETHLDSLVETLQSHAIVHGDYPKWRAAVDSLPITTCKPAITDDEHWQIDMPALATDQAAQLESALKTLMPWRKGPFKLGPVAIDTEWRSGWKWNRLIEHITPLQGRDVLDVGCGNGYHLWRMHEAGARLALGVEPSMLFNMQFQAVQRYSNLPSVAMLPLTFEQFPKSNALDTVFSMGVLYHRKTPDEHLQALKQALRPGGELILETLVAPGEEDNEIPIEERYAGMRNLWHLPSVLRLARWLEEASFTDIRCVSINVTSVFEQRSTDWMTYHSLANALDPNDKTLTIEGLPRPRRAVLVATRPTRQEV